MRWRRKAWIMNFCSRLPWREQVYRLLQKRFGRLVADPMGRLPAQAQMARWLREKDYAIEGIHCLEVGTGHVPTLPIGFFICGAASVVTVDLNMRLDFSLL